MIMVTVRTVHTNGIICWVNVNVNADVQGSTAGSAAIAGMISKETLVGWDVEIDGKKKHVNGGYSTMYNPVALPMRILNVSVYLDVWV